MDNLYLACFETQKSQFVYVNKFVQRQNWYKQRFLYSKITKILLPVLIINL